MTKSEVILKTSFNTNQEHSTSDPSYQKKLLETDEDFSNAIDVLNCILGDRNKSIITELTSIYERKSSLVLNLIRTKITTCGEEK